MKKLGQIVLMIALVLFAAQPIFAALPAATSCTSGMPGCASMPACCAAEMASRSLAMDIAQVEAPSSMPCQRQSCAEPAPAQAAILTFGGPIQRVIATPAVSPAPPLQAATWTLLHRPIHPHDSGPPLSILLQVFRI